VPLKNVLLKWFYTVSHKQFKQKPTVDRH